MAEASQKDISNPEPIEAQLLMLLKYADPDHTILRKLQKSP